MSPIKTLKMMKAGASLTCNHHYSWNKTLAYERGCHMGGEFRKKGVQVALGPVVGPLGRIVTGGRNWEGQWL